MALVRFVIDDRRVGLLLENGIISKPVGPPVINSHREFRGLRFRHISDRVMPE